MAKSTNSTKSTSSADSASSGENGARSRLGREIAGIAILAVALYTGISLVSYHTVSNWGGVVGRHLSDVLLTSIGYTSYLFPLLLVVISLEFLLKGDFDFRAALPVSFLIFVASSSAFLSGVAATKGAGGVLGDFLSFYLISYLGFYGAVIILAATALIAVLVATNISLVGFTAGSVRGAASLARSAAEKARDLVPERSDEEDEPEPGKAENKPPAAKKPKLKAVKGGASSGPTIVAPGDKPGSDPGDEEEELEFTSPGGDFSLPPLSLLEPVPAKVNKIDNETLIANSRVLEQKLSDFGVEGRVVEVRPGPVVTMYEFEPAPGIKVGRITNLSNDLALAMKAMSVRIIAPIPGKSVVGIEIPNPVKEPMVIREMFECPSFARSRSPLCLALGKDISGTPYMADFARMPHLLVAGATGAGKSVSVNAMIVSILYKATPDDVRFVMVDPKMLELSAYEGIPHLITPVITDPKKAAGALRSIVREMGRRYKLMAEKGARNIDRYNQVIAAEQEKASKTGKPKKTDEGPEDEAQDHQRLPYIVVVIDELADLMMTSGKDVEEALVRLSQMARAAGIHLLVATQRPSVDVVTGLVKTNFPARIAFKLPSKTDSRTILDAGGAETLLGEGDMLFLPPGTSKLQRIHGVFVSEDEIKRVTDFWKKQGSPTYDDTLLEESESYVVEDEEDLGEEFMARYREAVEMASEMDMLSTSYIQRRFRIGYNTAARIIEKMEKDGIVGPSQGSRPREVLKNNP